MDREMVDSMWLSPSLPADLFASLVASSPIGIIVLGPDGLPRFANRRALEILGIAECELADRAREWISQGPVADAWYRAMRGEFAYYTQEIVITVAGAARTVEVSVSRSDRAEGPAVGTFLDPPEHLVVRIIDHTKQRDLEVGLEVSERRYQLLVESLPGIVYIAEPGPTGRWDYVSPQIEQVLGFTAEEWLADREMWASRLHPEDMIEAIKIDEENALDGPRTTTSPQVYRMLRKDGSAVWIRDGASVVVDDQGQVMYHGVLTDVTHEKVLEDRLAYLATHDELTGLANRTSFIDALNRALRDQTQVAVAFVDLDRLKEVNDTWGHQVGDRLLREVGHRISNVTGSMPGVLAARIAGDEFAVVDAGLRGLDAPHLGGLILTAVAQAATGVGSRLITARASVGTVVVHPPMGAEEALARADRAMYRAKASGGGQVWSES